MNRSRASIAAATAVVLVGLAGLFAMNRQHSNRTARAERIERVAVTRNDPEIRDQDISFYTRRTLEDTAGAADRETLAALLFARSRSTGSMHDLARAESLARKSVALRTERNGQAFELLASVLMARHAFREARAVVARADSLARKSVALRTERNGQAFELLASVLMARHAFREARAVVARANSLSPDTPSHLALLGEIELELGEYDAAATHFKAIRFDGEQFTIGARLARWYELTGHADIARSLLTRAIDRVSKRDDLPREQAAWFNYRLGELELREGHFTAADSAFRAGLIINPEDMRVLSGLTRLEVARGQWQRAIDYGARATAVQLDPATVGAMSTAYAAIGDSVQSASFAKAMSVSALTQPGAIHRAWGLFLLDHGTAADRRKVLRLARAEIKDRRDVYGYDLLAWALFRAGKTDEARVEMSRALAQNTQDVMLREHARMLGAQHTLATNAR